MPFDIFCQILTNTAAKCSIPIVPCEESYTSKASLFALDEIPVYKEGDQNEYVFSGKRIRRGLYRAADRRFINADVNGTGSIIRKEYPDAFGGLTFDYLYKTTLVVKYKDCLRTSEKRPLQ